MSKLRVELNSAGVRELLRSPELRALVEKHARAARQRAGDGYEVYTAHTRVVALVGTATGAAEADNLKNNTLLKALR